jgi:hypothetical protein
VAGALTTRLAARDSRKGQNPGTALRRAGPHSGAGIPAKKTVGGFFRSRNEADTFRKENAPKGESHERRRCETKPARNRREEAVKRVPKP